MGRPPILRRRGKRREVSSIVLLTAPLDGRRPRLYARHALGPIGRHEVRRALACFQRRLGRPVCLMRDHLAAHRSREVAAYVAAHPADFTQYWLPGDAPELNPEDQCNRCAKRRLENAAPMGDEELRAAARRVFRQLQHHPAILAAFFRHAGLRVNGILRRGLGATISLGL